MGFRDLGSMEREFIHKIVVETSFKLGYRVSLLSSMEYLAVPLVENCTSFEELEPFIATGPMTCFVIMKCDKGSGEYYPLGAMVIQHGRPGKGLEFRMYEHDGNGNFNSKEKYGLSVN